MTAFRTADGVDQGERLDRRPQTKWKVLRWLFLVIAVGALYRYVSRNAEDFRFIFDIRADLLLLLFALQLTSFVVTATAFYRVARGFGLRVSFVAWIRIYATSRLLNIVVPQSANAYRVAKLRASHGFPIASYAATVVMFALLTRVFVFALVLLTVVAYAPQLRLVSIPVVPVLASGLAGVVCVLYFLVLLERRYQGFLRRLLRGIRVRPTLCFEMARELRRPELLGQVFIWTSINYSLSLLAHWLCFALVGADLAIAEIALFRLLGALMELVVLTPGNIGTTEAGYGILARGLNHTPSEGIVVGALISAMSILAAIAAFAISYIAGSWMALKRGSTSHRRTAEWP